MPSSPPSTAARETWKRLSPEDRRSQLLAIAEELFQSRPYEEIGVVDVAKAAGITHGLIYHYFQSKEALFIAVFEARASELLALCAPDTTLPMPEQVAKAVKGYLDYVEEHRVSYLNLFRGVIGTSPELARLCEETRQSIIGRFLDALGVGAQPLPATRLSMRGYLGYVEAAVLEWLETKPVPRPALETLIYSAIGAALRTGFVTDGQDSPELRALFDGYDAHFGLR